MSQAKHLHTLSRLSAHPIARNIEWAELIPALATIGLLQTEANGNYRFTRNGHTITFERSERKTIDVEDVIKLRHFLRQSAQPVQTDAALLHAVIIAVDHHKATIVHEPGTAGESVERLEADLSQGRILHKTKHHAPYHDENPTDDSQYFNAIVKSMMKSQRIVILSHGTGSSSAAEKLLAIVKEGYPLLLNKIIAIQKCDLEAMTDPQIIAMGTDLLHESADKLN